MPPISEARRRANEKYNAKAYEEIKVRIPRGQKATVEAAAVKRKESINSYVSKAILSRMKLKEWPDLPITIDTDSQEDEEALAKGETDGASWTVR